MKVLDAIETIVASVPGAPFPNTVDTLKIGDGSQELTGIVVTFMATCEVIQRAARLGANFIITHEPTFYNHLDETNWLDQHPVYTAKRRLVEENRLVIWRFHDYLHSLQPDSTIQGFLETLGWEAYASSDPPFLCTIPPQTLGELGRLVKTRLGADSLRVVGELSMPCKKVAFLPGCPGGEIQVTVLGRPDVDVVITGEIHEWEVSEYARDATRLGIPKGLIVTGHAASEDAGVKGMVPWFQARLPGIPIHFVSAGSAFHYL